MATNLLHFRPVRISACATSGHRKSDAHNRKQPSSTNWWTPLFGWSSDPDYIDFGNNNNTTKETKSETGSESESYPKPMTSRAGRGTFTADKAKQLRMMTADSYHDAMYHSAIATRLASDFSDRSDL